ncbi:uncharacterized protein BXZ73DRAFT_89303 [Epithele typhae]|uniref:uncharacterized protein n=1 Tax=Epithele typhae TaxID=378194 RepID=UPI0020084B59|nr:uncharacterized protein BXZ73DRAFT_89303 [Epithele typhae]KAH9936803.1 hypothetical protein BXZ73DRAFT_89303 [Epithele typhae]
MFSFSALAVFSTIAFGALSSALPVDLPAALPVNALGALPIPALGRRIDVPVVGDLGLPIRRHDVAGVAVVLTQATAKLGPATDLLKFVTAENCTVQALTAPVHDIQTILLGTVAELKELVGQPVDIILASVEGTAQITVEELAHIICGLLTIVFTGVRAVLIVAGAAIDATVFNLLVLVGGVVGELLAVLLPLVGSIVGELLYILVPLLKTLVPIILHLNLAQVISLLHLQ